MRPAALALVVLVAACSNSGPSDESLMERRPDVVGWVVDRHYSSDYQASSNHDITRGWVEFDMRDGRRLILDANTATPIRACGLVNPEVVEGWACWIHAGLGDDGVTARWVTAFLVANPDRSEFPRPMVDVLDTLIVRVPDHHVAYHLPGEIVLDDGTVLPYNPAEAEFRCTQLGEPDRNDLASYEWLLDITVNPTTGAPTEIRCYARM